MLQRIKKCYRENSCLNIKTWLHNSPADTLYEHLYFYKTEFNKKTYFLFNIFRNLLVITYKNGINDHACIGVELHQS
jgi:hypothetical protein